MTTSVLFLCPHSAGKSLLGATYFRAAAERLGLDVEIDVDVAGPGPDEHNMENVTSALERQGYTIGWTPKLVSIDDTARADTIVSIGCEHADIPTDATLTEWDVPMLSEDLDGSIRAIYDHAEQLAASML